MATGAAREIGFLEVPSLSAVYSKMCSSKSVLLYGMSVLSSEECRPDSIKTCLRLRAWWRSPKVRRDLPMSSTRNGEPSRVQKSVSFHLLLCFLNLSSAAMYPLKIVALESAMSAATIDDAWGDHALERRLFYTLRPFFQGKTLKRAFLEDSTGTGGKALTGDFFVTFCCCW
jgi:hypothetical protein